MIRNEGHYEGLYVYKRPISVPGVKIALHQIVLLERRGKFLQLEYMADGVWVQEMPCRSFTRLDVEEVGRFGKGSSCGREMAGVLENWLKRPSNSYNSKTNNCIDFAEELVRAYGELYGNHPLATHFREARMEASRYHALAAQLGEKLVSPARGRL